jgi:hypothetical protein
MSTLAQTTTTSISTNPQAFIGVIVILVIVVAVILVVIIKKREVSFDGQVIDKNVQEYDLLNLDNKPPMNNGNNISNGNSIAHDYFVKVETTNGKTINYQVPALTYETINIGDRVSKQKGKTKLVITSNGIVNK